MKKKYIFIGIFLIFFMGILVYQYNSIPDGSTRESREEILEDKLKGSGWEIAVEQQLENYLICGAYSTDNKIGIAVFDSVNDGTYKLINREQRSADEIIISGFFSVEGTRYDIVWFNGAATSHAELTYTYNGNTEKITFYTKDFPIIYNVCEAEAYTLEVVYYGSDGKIYK